jgi:hypothetical protein
MVQATIKVNRVGGDLRIGSENGDIEQSGLRHKQAIEGVAVQFRQPRHGKRVAVLNRDRFCAQRAQPLGDMAVSGLWKG